MRSSSQRAELSIRDHTDRPQPAEQVGQLVVVGAAVRQIVVVVQDVELDLSQRHRVEVGQLVDLGARGVHSRLVYVVNLPEPDRGEGLCRHLLPHIVGAGIVGASDFLDLCYNVHLFLFRQFRDDVECGCFLARK